MLVRCVFGSRSKIYEHICVDPSGECEHLCDCECVCLPCGCLPRCVYLFATDDSVSRGGCEFPWHLMDMSILECALAGRGWALCPRALCVSLGVWVNVPLSGWCECDGGVRCLGVAVCGCVWLCVWLCVRVCVRVCVW